MAGPFKMKGSPMQRNFGIGSPLRQDKMKASQTKIDAKTGVTTVDKNPGSKDQPGEPTIAKMPLNPDGSRMTKEQYIEYLAELQSKTTNMPTTNKGKGSTSEATNL